MYPFGLAVCVSGHHPRRSISVLLGIRAGNEGQHLAWVGYRTRVSVGAGTAVITIYRFYQLAFEGSLPFPLPFDLSI